MKRRARSEMFAKQPRAENEKSGFGTSLHLAHFYNKISTTMNNAREARGRGAGSCHLAFLFRSPRPGALPRLVRDQGPRCWCEGAIGALWGPIACARPPRRAIEVWDAMAHLAPECAPGGPEADESWDVDGVGVTCMCVARNGRTQGGAQPMPCQSGQTQVRTKCKTHTHQVLRILVT
jgi:hypothetical protein